MQIDNYGFAKEKKRKFVMELIIDRALNQYNQKLPFIIYKKPESNSINGLFQKNNTLFEVTNFFEKGFVFASFDGSKSLLIPEDQSDRITSVFQKKEITTLDTKQDYATELAKNNFKNLISKGIQAIKNNEFKKVVLSRKETTKLANFDVVAGFEKLVQLYPTTFVYCFFHPKAGIWLGATPEQLIQANDSDFKTIALAGTQKDQGFPEIIWKKKEEEEQQVVTDYIVEKLKNVTTKLVVSKPYSIKAGTIWHIRTDISGTLNPDFGLQKVIQLLHPTPAVCGVPKEVTKAFLLKNENYDRTFYTGFLGELNIENKSDLFVNLRCMEIEVSTNIKDNSKLETKKAHLFMGCGITKDSVPEKEWEESVNKSMTMKKILDCRF
jgi:isochorismate synthase